MLSWSAALAGVLVLALMSVGTAGWAAPQPELKIALTTDAGSMDPYQDNSVVGLAIQGLIFEPLMDYRGPNFTATPLVATGWQALNTTTWRFFIRQGIKFQDGTPLTADDVQFSIELAKNSPSARGKVANITGVTVVSPYVVDIHTAGPAASLLSNLAYIFIVPKANYQKRGAAAFGLEPVGSGPYRLEQWQKGQQIVLAAFDGYWGGAQSPARLTIRPISEDSTRFAELLTGSVDVIQDVPVEDVAQLQQRRDFAIVQSKGVRQIYFPMNTKTDTPLRLRAVRQAINFAIDRDTIVKDILNGFAQVRTGPWGPGQLGYNADAARFYGYNPDKAKALLKQSGYPNGFSVTWDLCHGCWLKDTEVLQTIANELKAVGIRVNINLIETNQLFTNQDAGHFQIGMERWSRQYDTDTILAGISVQSGTQPYYANPDVDALLAKGRQTLDPAARGKVYQQLFQVLVEDAPFVYTHAQDAIWAKRTSVPWVFTPFVGNAGMTLLNK
ncbi:MAG TPA: ABC transporter substrate-binding protein [bacterium]|nr:ABC transporter substrate-binding protein [bacterium]